MIKKLLRRVAGAISRFDGSILKPRRDDSGSLRVILGDLNPSIASALATSFHDVDSVEVIQGDLTKFEADAITSPANSFGDMSGGIDRAIDAAFDGQLQEHVQTCIREQYLGELPVGTALIIPTGTEPFRYVIVAPTMRVPGLITGTINAYLAMRAILANLVKFNATQSEQINSVCVSGLGTGVGGLAPDDSASQMRSAYDNVVLEKWLRIRHAAQAPYATR